MSFKNCLTALAVVPLLYGCAGGGGASEKTADSTATVAVDSVYLPQPKVQLTKIWETDTTLTTCESVIYDAKRDAIYVACINGAPDKKDGNGFITKINASGKVETLKWATGLDAPKGMGIIGDKLYVTDVDKLVEIDILNAKVSKKYSVKAAKFLNDITTSETTVFFTDMNTNTIHQFTPADGKLAVVSADTTLGSPNGLYFDGGSQSLYIATFGDQRFKKLDLASKKIENLVDGIEQGDGVVSLGNGAFLVSSWGGLVRYVSGGQAEEVLNTKDNGESAADIWFIPEKNLLLIPTFFKNKVTAYQVKVN